MNVLSACVRGRVVGGIWFLGESTLTKLEVEVNGGASAAELKAAPTRWPGGGFPAGNSLIDRHVITSMMYPFSCFYRAISLFHLQQILSKLFYEHKSTQEAVEDAQPL